MREIYLVVASYDYEGTNPVKAFTKRIHAERFAKICVDYEKLKPTAPEMDCDEKVWDEFIEKNEKHMAGHPAEREYGADNYYVRELELE